VMAGAWVRGKGAMREVPAIAIDAIVGARGSR